MEIMTDTGNTVTLLDRSSFLQENTIFSHRQKSLVILFQDDFHKLTAVKDFLKYDLPQLKHIAN